MGPAVAVRAGLALLAVSRIGHAVLQTYRLLATRGGVSQASRDELGPYGDVYAAQGLAGRLPVWLAHLVPIWGSSPRRSTR